MLVAFFLIWSALQLIDNTSAAPWLSSTTLHSRASSINLPSCATSCIWNSIQKSFPTSICSDQLDLNCLCTNRGLTGFTIGEEILECIASDCPDATSDQLSQDYSICNSIPNAVQPTHSTLTAKIPRETTIFAQPAPSETTSKSQTTTSTSSVTSFATSPSIAQTAPASSTSSTTTPTSTPIVTPVLSNSQIIGVTVGLGALALIAMALLTYICCIRRRKRSDSEQSFSTTQPLIPHIETSSAMPPSASQTNPYVPSKAQSFLGQKYQVWSPATVSNPIYPSYQGLATTPRPDERSTTPGSAITYQTTSKLLPDKPSYPGPSRPLRDGSEGELLTVPSTGRTRGSPSTFQASPDSFNSGPIVNRKPSDPFLQAPEPFYTPSRDINHGRNTRMNLPKLNTKTVQFATETPPADLPQQPIVPYNPTNYAYFAETQVPNWRAGQTQKTNTVRRGSALGNDYTQRQESTTSDFKPIPPPKAEPTFNKYKPIPRAKARTAASTVTSFESDDEDNGEPVPKLPPLPIWRKPVPATAPQNDRRLSHRYEHQQAPRKDTSSTLLSQVQYPAVPNVTTTPDSRVAKSPPVHPFIAKQRQEQSNSSPHEVSPLTPQIQRKEPFVLPRWDQDLLDQMILPTSSSRTDAYTRPVQYEQNTPSSPWERVFRPYPHDEIPASPSPVDVSRLLDQGFVELPERNSGQNWNFIKAPASYEPMRNISTIPYKINTRSIVPEPAIVTPQRIQPAPMMLAELPSPDAERLANPMAQAVSPRSPKSESRGARLGAAVANKTPQARPRGASDGNVRSPQQTQRPGHTRTQSGYPNTRPPMYNPPRPLEEIGLEPAARRYRDSPSNASDVNGNLRGTAKYTILCAPGQN